jgi:hypothetical protein
MAWINSNSSVRPGAAPLKNFVVGECVIEAFAHSHFTDSRVSTKLPNEACELH